MKYYRVIFSVDDYGLSLDVLNLIVEAKDYVDAITAGIHTYRLGVPEGIKALDINSINCYECSALEEEGKKNEERV